MEENNILTFKCSASCGDMIYSLMVVKQICERLKKKAVYYIENDNRFAKARKIDTLQSCKRLFEAQSYIDSCKKYEGQGVDYDLDLFRKQPEPFHKYPLPNRFFNALQEFIPKPFEPWLIIESMMQSHDVLLNHTCSYNYHRVDFNNLIKDKDVIFIGTKEEANRYPDMVYLPTTDLYAVAQLIKSTMALYCNQSACLTIAQGLGHPVFLAKDNRYNNTVLGLETLL